MLGWLAVSGCAGEVLAGIGGLLHGAFPVGVPEDIVHLRQAARVEDAHVGAEQVGDAGDDADGLEGRGFRGTSAAGNGRPCIGADDGDGLDLGRIERQEMAFVLEQRDAFQCAFKRDRRSATE